MTTFTSTFGKAIDRKVAATLHARSSSGNGAPALGSLGHAFSNGNGNGKFVRAPSDPELQRELFVNVLTAAATKRDAKQYLARFPKTANATAKDAQRNARHRLDQDRLDRVGVNLGGLYVPARAIADSPRFLREADVNQTVDTIQRPDLHVALVCLRAPQSWDDATLAGVVTTLSQLARLDMQIIVVLEAGAASEPADVKTRSQYLAEQANRLVDAFRGHSEGGARYVPGALEITTGPTMEAEAGSTFVAIPKLLLEPLRRGVVPVVPTLAYTSTGRLVDVDFGDVMISLTNLLSGRPTVGVTGELTDGISLNRLIVLHSAGGIPSKNRGDNAHVFINLEQEFDDILAELSEYTAGCAGKAAIHATYEQHRDNLRMLQGCLAILPSASSALIISPREVAASSSETTGGEEPTLGAGTRRQKNTLIHNLLTNKPTISSSLPTARVSNQTSTLSVATTAISPTPTATLVKRGMPVTILPAVHGGLGWHVPVSGHSTLELKSDPRVDFPRLLHLIENSFRRELDVEHYLNRISSRTAGLIVAGSYEGAAILTWEQPPGITDPARAVPYLDKFAVLQSSQGSSGVADILFQCMVRSCFPQGVCWRSRKDNPVNKWYFERAAGTWQLPGSNWTMFWTGEGVVTSERLGDYVGVCRDVLPSWKDGRRPD